MFIFNFLATVFLADFVSGFVHWAEDAYARPGMKYLNGIAVENAMHHTRPREFLKKNWWQSSWDLALLSVAALLVAWALGSLTWEVWLFALLAANSNQIHKWSHRSRFENGWLIRALQKSYLLQTPRHHARHHSGDKNTHYCVITNFLNPILEEIDFWVRLERVNKRLFHMERHGEPGAFCLPQEHGTLKQAA